MPESRAVSEKPSGWLSRLRPLLDVVLGVAAVVSLVWGYHAYTRQVVRGEVQRPEFLRALARHVRPSVVFDSKGSILLDQGACEYLADDGRCGIRYEPAYGSSPERVVVVSRTWLAAPPLLEGIDSAGFEAIPERGLGFEWHYRLGRHGFVESDPPNPRFRIEVIP